MSPKPNRILGFDLARSLAVFGMVIVNFKIVMGADKNGPDWLVDLVGLLSGRAAATFVVLAGIGIALMTRKARVENDPVLIREKRISLCKRAAFLFIGGLAYTPIWPADILHFYGVYIAVAALLIRSRLKTLLTISTILPIVSTVLVLTLDYSKGWNWDTLEHSGFWTLDGIIRHLFFNGFHPVLPWLSFLLVGIAIGRLDFTAKKVRRLLLIGGASLALVVEATSRTLVWLVLQTDTGLPAEDVYALFGSSPMPPMPFYVLAGTGTAVALISAMVSLAFRFEGAMWLRPFVHTGQLALSLYVFHVLLGMGCLQALGLMHNQPLSSALLAATLYFIAAVVFSSLWRRRFEVGPVEFLMRSLTK